MANPQIVLKYKWIQEIDHYKIIEVLFVHFAIHTMNIFQEQMACDCGLLNPQFCWKLNFKIAKAPFIYNNKSNFQHYNLGFHQMELTFRLLLNSICIFVP